MGLDETVETLDIDHDMKRVNIKNYENSLFVTINFVIWADVIVVKWITNILKRISFARVSFYIILKIL